MAYTFSTLNDKDLEVLALDILSRKLNKDFQSFRMGADKGIDLRYATIKNENDTIVQVKHYVNSGISKLKIDLKKKEVNKVRSLNPKRYILVTSLSLSPLNKEQIKTILQPYIISTSDILGKNELNYFLRKFPDVETAHFKLWLSNTNILNRILKNGIKARSEFYDKKIKDRIKIFVPNKTHRLAVEVLNKNHFILITGAPGIGKSTLANMLTYQLLAQNYELVYIREILEGEDLILPGKKQVFFFDDFLGSITLDLRSSRNADSAIANFIERIKADNNKRLLLTCRTTILNQAIEESEKLENAKLETSSYEVRIEDYTDIEKARILYNHIYFSNLPEELKETFFTDHFYWSVIRHQNYNPRIIEFFTDPERLQPGVSYKEEVLKFLKNPAKIWEKSFSTQISQNARFFLATLYSLGGKFTISENMLKEAFEARLNYEVTHNNHRITNANIFNLVVRELLGGFIIRTHETTENHTSIEYRFFNPSIEDFLFYYFTNNIEEYFTVLKSAVFFEQFKWRITTKDEKALKRIYLGEKHSVKKLFQIFNNRLGNLTSIYNKDLETVVILIELFNWEKIREKVVEVLNQFSATYLNWEDRINLIKILKYIAEGDLFSEFDFSIHDMLLALSQNMSSHYQVEDFSNLISTEEIYREIIEDALINNGGFIEKVQQNIDRFWRKYFNDFVCRTHGLTNITTKSDLVAFINKRKKEAKELNESIGLNYSPTFKDYNFDYDGQLKKNIKNITTRNSNINDFQDDDASGANEILEVNRLFNGEDNFRFDTLPF